MGGPRCVVPLVVQLRGVPDDDRLADASDAIARAVAGRLHQANRVIAAREGWNSWHRNYAATLFRFSGIALDDDLQRRVTAAIEAGVASAIAGQVAATTAQSPFVLAQYHPPADELTQPASTPPGPRRTKAGAKKTPPQKSGEIIKFEADILVVDRVIEKPPPFQGALVLRLPGNHYVSVNSHRYAASDDIARAQKWGRVLFGAEAWVMVVRNEHHRLMYYVASLDEALTLEDIRAQTIDTGVPGALGVFLGRVLPTIVPDYSVVSVFFRGEGRAAPTKEAFVAFNQLARKSQEEGTATLDPAPVRKAVFDPIDKLLEGGDDNLQKAADLLAELDATAFATLDTETRFRYLCVLIKAWTWEPQEKAVVQILKSVASLTELQSLFEQLKTAQLWDQLFNDLDSELWSMLVTIGEKFGDPAPLTFTSFLGILLEAKLLSPAPGVVFNKEGKPEISLDLIAELEEAARGFVRFLQGTLEGIWMMLSHPDKIIEGIGQLVKMLVMFELAKDGYAPAQLYVSQIVGAIGKQLLFGLKGVAITEMGPAIERRIRYAIIWEVASLFIGVGEVKAILEGAGLTERLAAVASLLRLLGVLEETAEGEKLVAKLEKLAEIMSRSSKLLKRDEEVLKLLSHLPERDVKLLSEALEKADLGEGLDLAKLAETNRELAEIATESLRKSEALSEFAEKAGGLSDQVIDTFKRLAGRHSGEEISAMLGKVPNGEGSRFVRAVAAIPEDLFAGDLLASREFLNTMAGSTKRMDALVNYGYKTFGRLYEHAGNPAELDQYLEALVDIEKRLQGQGKAAEFRRILDELERVDPKEWLELERARIARFESTAAVEDPATIEKMIDEELAKFPPEEAPGAKPLVDPTAPPPPGPPPVTSFKDALAGVNTDNIPADHLAKLKAGWKKYLADGKKALRSEDEYIRFRWGHDSKQWPKIVQSPRDLGEAGAIEQEAGHLLERVVDARLPSGSANTRAFPTGYSKDCIPDHLPPGKRTTFLNPDGTVSATGPGTPFSARIVADSKYRELIPTNDQTRGFVKLAALSDEKKLVFYVRWQEGFPAVETLGKDALGAGYRLPDRFVGGVVQSGISDLARESGVEIQLASDPLWR